MNQARIRFLVFILLGPGLAMGPGGSLRATAQNPTVQPPEDEPPTRRLVLQPATEPRPALKYELLPGLLDRRPGNAAVLYNKIGLTFRGGAEFAQEQNKISQWIDGDLPLEKFPREEARKIVERWGQVLDDLELASRCEQCDWELPLRERDFISLMLPEIQESRNYARLLSLKARLQIVDGDFDGAIRSVRTGYALARHVARSPTLISALVGVAISGVMNARVEELATQPGAPSLYWALTELPDPLVDFRLGMEAEKSMLYLTYPEFRDLDRVHRSPEEWRKLFDKICGELLRVGAEKSWAGRAALTFVAIKGYPAAKRRLVDSGRSPEQVDAMPASQAVLLNSLAVYEETRDAMFKWTTLPYWQAAPQIKKVEEENNDRFRTKEVLPLDLFLPPGNALLTARTRSRRNIAMLRVIEAIRLFVASHEGRLPTQLADLADFPIPDDPITGGPFIYRAQGDRAVLEAPLLPDMPQRNFGARYEINFAH